MTRCPHTLSAKNANRANSKNVFSKCQTMDKAQNLSRLMLNYVLYFTTNFIPEKLFYLFNVPKILSAEGQ